MKTLLAAALVLAAITPALADPQPKIKPQNVAAPPALYIGKWCGRPYPADESQPSWRYSGDGRWDGDCRKEDERIQIEKGRIIFREPDPDADRIFYVSVCTFQSIRLTGDSWPRSTKPAREDWVPTIAIRCRETGKRLLLEWVKGDQIDMYGR